MNSVARKAAQKMRKRLVQLFPRCFQPRPQPKLPLKNNIVEDIVWRCPELDQREVKLALLDYCFGETYLGAIVIGATRFDLDGAPAGTVSAWAALRAANKLKRMRENNARQAARTASSSREKPGTAINIPIG